MGSSPTRRTVYWKVIMAMTPLEECEQLRQRAYDDETYETRCIMGEKIFYHPTDKAYLPGQIYTQAGLDEYRKISGVCEYHFDEWFKEEDDDGIDEDNSWESSLQSPF